VVGQKTYIESAICYSPVYLAHRVPVCVCVHVCVYECETQMMLADGPSNGSPPVIKLPYSSTACSLMSLLSAMLATLALSDTEKRHSAGAVTAIANTDTIASQTTDIVRYCLVIDVEL